MFFQSDRFPADGAYWPILALGVSEVSQRFLKIFIRSRAQLETLLSKQLTSPPKFPEFFLLEGGEREGVDIMVSKCTVHSWHGEGVWHAQVYRIII